MGWGATTGPASGTDESEAAPLSSPHAAKAARLNAETNVARVRVMAPPHGVLSPARARLRRGGRRRRLGAVSRLLRGGRKEVCGQRDRGAAATISHLEIFVRVVFVVQHADEPKRIPFGEVEPPPTRALFDNRGRRSDTARRARLFRIVRTVRDHGIVPSTRRPLRVRRKSPHSLSSTCPGQCARWFSVRCEMTGVRGHG
jgi:hypothetical protein